MARAESQTQLSLVGEVSSVAIDSWWDEDLSELYWLEVTERPDIGADLRAPQKNGSSDDYWSYSLVREVKDGDFVLHYRKADHTIRHWSRASGGWWEDDIFWGARGTAGRSHEPFDRPGWVHGLEGPFPLQTPVTLQELRHAEPALRNIRNSLRSLHGDPLYFPFEIGDRRPLRAAQGYLFKLPAAAAALILGGQELAGFAQSDRASGAKQGGGSTFGSAYRRADESTSSRAREPFSVDPDIVDRGTRGHRRVQNLLADHLAELGLEPRSPGPLEPAYDLAWKKGTELWVAEVKSLTKKNEERQLRLGLGQLLRYRHILGGDHVHAVLVVERQPSDPSWLRLCEALAVSLVWPESLSDALA